MSAIEGRRRFLRLTALATLSGLLPGRTRAATVERRLSFYNTHTDESVSVVYWADGACVEDGLKAINRILRDFRTGDARNMDLRLLDLLFDLHGKLETTRPFHIISGYRSPQSNDLLRSVPGSGVAKASQHLLARAADIRVPGRRLETVHDAAVSLRRGGVGFYPSSDFVHVDVGRVRYW